MAPRQLPLRRILVVCTANQCRSPMAEGLLRARLAEADLQSVIEVSSAGTWTGDGIPATDHAVTTLAECGIDIGGHRSREVTEELLAGADLVLAMTSGHVQAMASEFPAARDKILLFSTLMGGTWDVADPVGGTPEDYRATARLLEDLIAAGWSTIIGSEGQGAEFLAAAIGAAG